MMKLEKNLPQNYETQTKNSNRSPFLSFSEKTIPPKSKRNFKNSTQKYQSLFQLNKPSLIKKNTIAQQKQQPKLQDCNSQIKKQMRVYSLNKNIKKQNIRISNGRIDHFQNQLRNKKNKLKQELKVNVQKIMINILLEKSKYLKQIFSIHELTQQWVTKNIKNNKSFLNSFNSFLSKLIEKYQLKEDLRNIDKKTFQKIQKFCHKQIQSILQMQEKQNKLNLKQTFIQQMITNRIQQLNKRLRKTQNIIS